MSECKETMVPFSQVGQLLDSWNQGTISHLQKVIEKKDKEIEHLLDRIYKLESGRSMPKIKKTPVRVGLRKEVMSLLNSVELRRYLPCFYDLPIKETCKLLKCPYRSIKRACDEPAWPHAQLKKRSLSFSWLDVERRRREALEDPETPTHVVRCLAKAVKTGWLMRRLYDEPDAELFDGLLDLVNSL